MRASTFAISRFGAAADAPIRNLENRSWRLAGRVIALSSASHPHFQHSHFPAAGEKLGRNAMRGPFLASVHTEGIILILPSKLHLSSRHPKKILENEKFRLFSFPENFLVTLLSP